MCAIFGFSARNGADPWYFNDVIEASSARGRDGVGLALFDKDSVSHRLRLNGSATLPHMLPRDAYGLAGIGNTRAEPTTEHVKDKTPEDQQPYHCEGWTIVHNGTIANDVELRAAAADADVERVPTNIDSAAIAETLARVEKECGTLGPWVVFQKAIGELKGSYAILARRDGTDCVFTACNYRPIWTQSINGCTYFASSREFFHTACTPATMQAPYSAAMYRHGEPVARVGLLPAVPHAAGRVLVVASGGLDSTVALAWAKANMLDVEMAHFLYGSRAEGPESDVVRSLANHYKIPVKFFNMRNLYDPEDSPLLRSDSDIAGGEAGAEFAHEWVPARNLVMLAVATAYAEAKGFDYILLGNNLEEAGAYPDNEPEFISRMNDVLPFAVGAGKRVQILMPVGNLMKHEIVALGHQLDAPMHLTWSCYRAGGKHCGTCGPCYMRRKAFEMNNLPEVIEYENQ